ncbi:triphosphoribosyl-dephospho-CoA synthase [Halorubellus sp. JP-L1]|uniref:triphosphoribosyl-dephospho-CoA synthase n=1 Tax=Halorubellus sp. JP-L1 TaxID=2715753 RepID=UPI00140B2AAD|nr:triphosphoribosyl-dephospho-CoA synthase [Halorubellus sp. JP-L1]
MYSTAANAELALLLEVAGTPKPGNVDRERDLPDLRFEHFLAGAVGARPGLDALADPSVGVGEGFERAVAGMSEQSGGNTQFGALLVLAPLVRAAATGPCTPGRAREVVAATTVEDAAAFYRSFDHVDVFVGDPPPDAPDLDVRRGSAAVPAVRDRDLTLGDLMAESADRDGVAAAWTTGFERAFDAADDVAAADGPLADRAADAFLALLAEEPDTLVAEKHGDAVAREVTERASDLREAGVSVATDRDAVDAFADDLVDRGVNPGTTADLVAGALFVALEAHGVRP